MSLQEHVEEIAMAAYQETFGMDSSIYANFKLANKNNVQGIDVVVSDLKQCFPRSKKKKQAVRIRNS